MSLCLPAQVWKLHYPSLEWQQAEIDEGSPRPARRRGHSTMHYKVRRQGTTAVTVGAGFGTSRPQRSAASRSCRSHSCKGSHPHRSLIPAQPQLSLTGRRGHRPHCDFRGAHQARGASERCLGCGAALANRQLALPHTAAARGGGRTYWPQRALGCASHRAGRR